MSSAVADLESNKASLVEYGKDSAVKPGPKQTTFWSPQRQLFMTCLHFVGSVLVYACRTAISVCMPQISKEFQWDKKQQGLVMACFLWSYPITQVFGGMMSDRVGAEKVIMIFACGWGLITLLTPLSLQVFSQTAGSALTVMIFTRFIQGLMQGVHYPSVMSMVNTCVVEKERTTVYSIIGAGTHGGTLSLGIVGSVLLHCCGWTVVFTSLGLAALLWVAALNYYGDINNQKITTVKENRKIESKIPSTPPSKRFPWEKVIREPAFWAMLLAHFCEGYTFFVLLFWLPSYFHDNFPEAQPWVYNVLPWLIDMTVSLLAGRLADSLLKSGFSKTYTRKALNIFGEFVLGAGLIMISYCDNYHSVLACFCLSAMGHGFYQCTVIMNPADLAPSHAGLMFGVMNTVGAIPGFLGTYISGAILEATHNWNLMYAVAGWVAVFGWTIFGYWGSGDPIID